LLVLVFLTTCARTVHAAFDAPTGYQAIDLGLSAAAHGVSASGELVTVNPTAAGATITLYDTWRPGRTVLKTANLNVTGAFTTDVAFVGTSSKVVFGENGPTDSLWTVDFGAATPMATQLTANGSFPAVQGVAASADGASLLVSGTTATGFDSGNLYLRRYTLAGGAVASIASNFGTDFAGAPAFTPGGAGILLEGPFGAAGSAHVFDLSTTTKTNTIGLGGGSGTGAYGIAFDNAGVAYVTTGDTITSLTNIDAASPGVDNFGTFAGGSVFLTGIAFTGGDFRPGVTGDTGALIVNNGAFTGGGLFAIVVPEPSSVAVVALGAIALLARRRGRRLTGAVVVAAALVALAGFAQPSRAAQFFATEVKSSVVGGNQNGSFALTGKALGGPRGDPGGVADVYNLGAGGSITLGFDDNGGATPRAIVDGPGADFIVFENPFLSGANSFAELLFVEVSTDGTSFARFPVVSNTPGKLWEFSPINPNNVSGFGGVHPVLANVDTNTINPFDPAVAGGDAFDLSALASHPLVVAGTVDLQQIRYLRLVDVIGDGSLFDDQVPAKPIYDPFYNQSLTAPGSNNGADLDAVSVINGAIVPEPGFLGALSIVLLLGGRRRSR
jgi:hypothetical protein